MKSIYAMIAISLAVLLMGAILVSLLVSQVNNVLDECAILIEAAAQDDLEGAAASAEAISGLIDRYRNLWHLLANHNDLDDIEAALLGVRMTIEQGSLEELGILCVELERALLHLSEKELLNIYNII